MTLAPGARVGPYEVTGPLGAGGMGEVYRARDPRLDREVAIKILPDPLASDPARRARFEREARVLASLNHPNIATVLGVEPFAGGQALVMELVEGQTLGDRLRGATGSAGLPVRDVVAIAHQVAAALEAAHEQGIVHRDLKPDNVAVRRDGGVKVLDFGLAKAVGPSEDPVDQATVTAVLTEGGAVGPGSGTPAYMSPEQVRGIATDKRTDVWAFGCFVYELLTGRRAFAADTIAELLACILEREPDFRSLPADTPPAIRRLLRRCLEKSPTKRLRDIGDARLDLEDAFTDVPAAGSATDKARRPRPWMWAAGALGTAAVVLLVLLVGERRPPATEASFLYEVFPPDNGTFLTPLGTGSAAPVGGTIAPDGQRLVFSATDSSGLTRLWLRRVGSLDDVPLRGTDGAALPFWSPDSRSVGFFAEGALKRIDVDDGTLQVLCDVDRGRGGSWSRDGVIIFAARLSGGLSRVDAAAVGEPAPLTSLGDDQRSHGFPVFLPDGQHFLYYVETSDARTRGIYLGALSTPTSRHRMVAEADSAAAFAPPDHLLFVRQGTLFALSFDPGSLREAGAAVPVAQSIPYEGAAPAFSVSVTGVLTYRSGSTEAQQFAWYDRDGGLLAAVGQPGSFRGGVDVSRDDRIAVHRHDGDGGDIWTVGDRGPMTPLTSDPVQDNSSPIWSPDGRWIAFGSYRNGKWGLYRKRADAVGGDELLLESDFPVTPSAWSPDDFVVYWRFADHRDSWRVPVQGGAEEPLIRERSYAGHVQVSPDGSLMAYMSDKNGTYQVYVSRYPSGVRERIVSTNGGVTPRWGPGGAELFYVTSYDAGTLMRVAVESDGETFSTGTPEELFVAGMVTPPHTTLTNAYHTYAVSSDGRRFLIPRPVSGTSTPIVVTINWPALLEQRASR